MYIESHTMQEAVVYSTCVEGTKKKKIIFYSHVTFAADGKEREVALQGMQHWMNHTCIRFIPKQDSDKDYIFFAQMNWCAEI